jgi:hypothetical protein
MMKWEYSKLVLKMTESYRITIEKAYHIDKKQNVYIECKQELINGEWQTVAVNEEYQEVK